ncbi:alpha-L-fucosidase [Streptomyces beijiangensis]|uniref:alpha-L-fucosidase n=1 Tax=Streptomyces beijiangensis TaxID=163361 RepID=A0A939F3S8_9ACTN|nr:alpha-L-fucosidase [Streptomyces beijiangensis]MBO0511209.1 alpha-L-fucosidase [Streptomyces beijiangensis]
MRRSVRTYLIGVLAVLSLLTTAVQTGFAATPGTTPPAGSELRDLAIGSAATQSSTAYEGAADRATDGSHNGIFPSGSVSHTAQQAEPWWQTDLGRRQALTKIVVWNRTDCCTERLSNFWVLVSDHPFGAQGLAEAKAESGVSSYRIGSLTGQSAEVALTRKARYLRIQLEGTDYLTLAEVQVFGNEIVKPAPAAQKWVKDNPFGMFMHFNMSTYQDAQWADPNGNPADFNPTNLDADQWAKSMKAAGMQFGVLTAKHHDGFALWPTKYSDYSIAASPYKNGKGDIVREYVDAMHANGLKVGLYFSIWDRHNGDSTELIENQLRELLTEYGQIDYLWFDGWGWNIPYSQIPYQPVRDMIRKTSPRTVVANNDHEDTLRTTDVIVYEVPVQGMPPATNPRPTDASDTLDTNRTWFHTTGTGAPRPADEIVSNLQKANAGNALFLLNVAPDLTGRIPDEYVDRLKEIGQLH